MMYLGDIAEDTTINFLWSTNAASGASITRATDGTVQVYKDNGDSESVAGVTDTEDFDGLVGLHLCTIDTSADAFYATGSDYSVVLKGAVIDGETVNAALATFSIENRFAEVNVTKIEGSDATDQINAACDASMVTYGLDHLVSASVAGADVIDNSIIAKLVSSEATADWDDYVNTTDSLQALRDRGDSAWVTVTVPTNFADLSITETTGRVDVTKIEGSDATDQINAACDASIVTYGLDHLMAAAVAGADVTDNSVIAKLVSTEATADWDDYVNTTDSLQALRDRGDSAWITVTSATINAACDSAIETYRLDEFFTSALSGQPTATSLLADLTEDDSGTQRFSINALEQAPGGGGGGDATAANQTTIINHLTDVKGTGFVKDTDSAVDLAHTGADSDTLESLSDQIDAVSGGSGAIPVDHNTGGADNLAYKTGGGVGIDNATVEAYLKSDYDAGNYGSVYLKAVATTDVNGQWVAPMMLDAETYTMRFYAQNQYGPATKEVVVS